jgi:hypothetical protein
MVYSVQQIKYEILAYIKEFGGDFSEWYVGIAADPKHEMFETHSVNENDDIWLYKQALTYRACKTIQDYFLDKLKTDGRSVTDGNEDTDCVFLYKKSSRTLP